MCEKKVVILQDVEAEIDNTFSYPMREDVKDMVKESALKNMNKRCVFENTTDINSETPYDFIFANFNDLKIVVSRLQHFKTH